MQLGANWKMNPKQQSFAWAPESNLSQIFVHIIDKKNNVENHALKLKFSQWDLDGPKNNICSRCILNTSTVRWFRSNNAPLEGGSQPTRLASGDLPYPPGFEGSHSMRRMKEMASSIPQIQWKQPPKFIISDNWQVASGEDSTEVQAQEHLEKKHFEAVYPHPYLIPPCAHVSPDVEAEHYDDSQTPLVPLIGDEEREGVDSSIDLSAQSGIEIQELSKALVRLQSILGADVITAVHAALSELLKSKEGKMVDLDLLIKILSDPKLVEKLISEQAGLFKTQDASNTSQMQPRNLQPSSSPILAPILKPRVLTHFESKILETPMNVSKSNKIHTLKVPTKSSSIPMAVKVGSGKMQQRVVHMEPNSGLMLMKPGIKLEQKLIHRNFESREIPMNVSKSNKYSSIPMKLGSVKMQQRVANMEPNCGLVMMKPGIELEQKNQSSPVNDNYLRNLVREYGVVSSTHKRNTSDDYNSKPKRIKISKPCKYYMTPMGCRNGAECLYRHASISNRGKATIL